MTLRRGEDWGRSGDLPHDVVAVATDREAAALVAARRGADEPVPPMLLTGGDLARTLGGGRSRDAHTHVAVDLGAVLADGEPHWFVAHLVARRRWLHGRIVVAANAAFLGRWNIAPRAHPGDGRLDILDADPPLGDRLKARRRLPLGTHVPHPAIRTRRVAAVKIELDRPTPLRLDGHEIGTARSLDIRVEPAALDVWI